MSQMSRVTMWRGGRIAIQTCLFSTWKVAVNVITAFPLRPIFTENLLVVVLVHQTVLHFFRRWEIAQANATCPQILQVMSKSIFTLGSACMSILGFRRGWGWRGLEVGFRKEGLVILTFFSKEALRNWVHISSRPHVIHDKPWSSLLELTILWRIASILWWPLLSSFINLQLNYMVFLYSQSVVVS